MKVYVVEDVNTGERGRVYGKGTRVYVSKHAAINRIQYSKTQKVSEYNLVPTGETWSN